MTRRDLLRLLPPGLAGVALAACAPMPVLNVTDAEFRGTGTLAQRGEAVRLGAQAYGWEAQPVRPGLMRAMLNIRTHRAVVDIAYTTTGFSISYVDSMNLDYDGARIHRYYNGWIENLRDSIVFQSGLT